MDPYDIATMLTSKKGNDLLKVRFGTVKKINSNGTADVLIDGSQTIQRLLNWCGALQGSRCMVSINGSQWLILSASATSGGDSITKPLPVADGGTGGATKDAAATNLQFHLLTMNNANNIANGANLNTYKTPGIYQVMANAGNTTITNTPILNKAFRLIVEKQIGSIYCQQVLQVWDLQQFWTRKCTNTTNDTWTAWHMFMPVVNITTTEQPTGRLFDGKSTYIRLFKGTITQAANTYSIINIDTSTNIYDIVNQGGWFSEEQNHRSQLNVGYVSGSNLGLGYIQINPASQYLQLYTIMPSTRASMPYSVWVEYTKK